MLPEQHGQADRGSISLSRLPSAFVELFRVLSFRWTIPISRSYTLNLAEVLLTGVYISVCLAWTLINTTSKKGVKFDPRYYANIASNIACSQLPFVVALGMRNNIISYLTGISFDKLSYLHGMTARTLVVLIWIHAGGRVALGLKGKVAITVPVIQAGVLAGVSLTLLSVVSIRPLRDRSYEFFLIVHFVLAFITILAGYFHAASLDFGTYIWPSFVLWGLDRAIRVVRLVISAFTNKPQAQQTRNNISSTTATVSSNGVHVELLSHHFLRLTIQPPALFHWRPGQSAYLTFPSISANPLEAHPFTIASIDVENKDKPRELKFFIRVRDGLTKRLLNAVETGGSTRVLVDGPYSSPTLLVGYDTMVLIAGGSGIAFTLPLFLDLLERCKTKGLECRRLTFIWAVRNLDHLTWIQSELLASLHDLPSSLAVSIHIFVSGSGPLDNVGTDTESFVDDTTWTSDDVEKTSSSSGEEANNEMTVAGPSTPKEKESQAKAAGSDLLALPMVTTHRGRGDLEKLIAEEVEYARDAMSITVCGTHALADAIRHSIRSPRFGDILRGGPTISLHVEAFGSG